MSADKIYSKYGKIVSMMDELQKAGCFDSSFTQPTYRIVVVGPKGSGKDAFINGLLGYAFLPVNCPTQREMDIHIVHSAEDISPMIRVEEGNKNFTQFRDCEKYIGDLQMKTSDSNRQLPIRMTLTSSSSADLFFISTPELEPRYPVTKSIIQNAMSPSCDFIVLVMDANILSADKVKERDLWFNMVKNADPQLERSMVVFTKNDTLPHNFDYSKIKIFLREKNEIFSPKYGFVCVKGNIPSYVDPSDQTRVEREFFCNHKTFGYLSNDYLTFESVGEKITRWIYSNSNFKKNLIYANQRLEERKKFVDEELKEYGTELMDFSSQSKDLYLQGMMNLLCETVDKAFSGKCEIEEYNLSNTNLRKTYTDFLSEYSDFRPSIKFKNDQIIQTIQRTEKSFLNGFPSGDVIYALLDKQIDEIRDEFRKYLDTVYDIVTSLMKSIIQRYFSRFPKAVNSIEELVMSFLEKEFTKTKQIQTDLAEMNFGYIYVDEMTDKYKNLMQNTLRGPAPSPQNNMINNMGNAINSIGGQQQQKVNNAQMIQQNNYPFQEKNDISFFKSNKDKNSYYQDLANYTKSIVDYIYAEIIRCLREYIPKASGNLFIKSLKTNMRFFLLTYISQNPEFAQELEEDPEVAHKRVHYVESQKILIKIAREISNDEKLTQIIKSDKMKEFGVNEADREKEEKEKKEKEEQEKKKKEKQGGLFSGTSSSSGPLSSGSNLFGVPPKNDTNKTNTSDNLKSNNKVNNLFGTSNSGKISTNNQTKTKANATNLFGNPTTNNNKSTAKTNLFGNPTTNKSTMNNLFGTPQQGQNRTTTNLFGNPSPNPAGNKNQGLDLNLKIDPSTGNVTGAKIAGAIDPKDIYNFYQKNKQYLPSGQQMLAGAKAVGNFLNQMAGPAQGGNNNNSGGNNKGLANLFGKK